MTGQKICGICPGKLGAKEAIWPWNEPSSITKCSNIRRDVNRDDLRIVRCQGGRPAGCGPAFLKHRMYIVSVEGRLSQGIPVRARVNGSRSCILVMGNDGMEIVVQGRHGTVDIPYGSIRCVQIIGTDARGTILINAEGTGGRGLATYTISSCRHPGEVYRFLLEAAGGTPGPNPVQNPA